MTEGGPVWVPGDVDPAQPSVARIYDYYLGGSHNFESDRAFARQALAAFPSLREVLRDNRAFLRRVVRQLSKLGVDQFLDLGSGIPTVGNVHEVAQAANPQATIVYVDHDPVAVAQSLALLAGNDRATAISGDIRDPQSVLEMAVGTGLLHLDRPLGVLFIAVMPFIDDAERPAALIAEFMSATPPGSYLAISHPLRSDHPASGVARVYNQSRSPNPMRFRTREEIGLLFGDLTFIDPGLVLMPLWRPEPADDGETADIDPDYPGLAGVGRRD